MSVPHTLKKIAAAMLKNSLRGSTEYRENFIRGYLAACVDADEITEEEYVQGLAALEPTNVTPPWWERLKKKP